MLQVTGAVYSLSIPSRGIGMGSDNNNSAKVGPVYYILGEKNAWQIASRAQRLGIDAFKLFLLCDTNTDAIANKVVIPS